MGSKGYFRHPSKLFYIKGIGVGQTPRYIFSAIFESVDDHHFLKNRSHSDLRLQRYAEVAENSLGVSCVSITKTWFSRLLLSGPLFQIFSNIWNFEYLFWYFQLRLSELNNNKYSKCPNQWVAKDISYTYLVIKCNINSTIIQNLYSKTYCYKNDQSWSKTDLFLFLKNNIHFFYFIKSKKGKKKPRNSRKLKPV